VIAARTSMIKNTAIAILVLIGAASSASARPMLDHASPAPASIVAQAPLYVALFFTEILSPSGSDAVVRTSTGGVISAGKARVVGNKAQLQVPVATLPPGKYRVEWYAISADQHENQGSFNFIVQRNDIVARGAHTATSLGR